jgi:predicted HicB family RNase H-like nuclease
METLKEKHHTANRSKKQSKLNTLDTIKKDGTIQHFQHVKSMESRKENPRSIHLGFKTDKSTQERIHNEAKKAGVPVSKFIHDKLKGAL